MYYFTALHVIALYKKSEIFSLKTFFFLNCVSFWFCFFSVKKSIEKNTYTCTHTITHFQENKFSFLQRDMKIIIEEYDAIILK